MNLWTERLRLETLEPRHAPVFFEGLQHQSLHKYTEDRPPTSVEELAERYARWGVGRSPDGSEDWLNWAVWSRPDRRYVGYVQATVRRAHEASIAYVFFRDSWGKGFAREAVQRMMEHLTVAYGTRTLHAQVDSRNHRSIALLQKLGFERKKSQTDRKVVTESSREDLEFIMRMQDYVG